MMSCKAKKNPLDVEYGGMRPGGGFEANTEYEVGAQRLAEAAHCILGSLHGAHSWHSDVEDAHVAEELGIIKKVMNEYYKEMYVGRLFQGKYALQSLESISRAAPRLKSMAECAKHRLIRNKDETDLLVYDVALRCYEVLIELATQMELSVLATPFTNAFASSRLRSRVDSLESAVKKWHERK